MRGVQRGIKTVFHFHTRCLHRKFLRAEFPGGQIGMRIAAGLDLQVAHVESRSAGLQIQSFQLEALRFRIDGQCGLDLRGYVQLGLGQFHF